MKRINTGVFAFLAAVFLICHAAQGVIAQDAQWRKVESDNDIAGRWESEFTMNIPANKDDMIPETSFSVYMLLDYVKAAANKASAFKVTLKMDIEKFLIDYANMPELRMIGLSKDSLWEIFIDGMKSALESSGEQVIVEKYYLSYTVSASIDEFLDDSARGQIFINKEKTKMKLIFNEPLSLGLNDEEIREIILTKKRL